MDPMEVQFNSAYELAQSLINNEVTLSELKSITAFAPKADLTEEAVWESCKANKLFSRYLEIYPNGKHKNEVEESFWSVAIERNDMKNYMDYLKNYPQGAHVAEVDDKVWEVAKSNGSIDAYLNFFPTGNHAQEARSLQAEQQQEEEAWQEASGFDTPESYRGYTESYPKGMHVAEANQRISELMAGQKERIIRALSEDRNAYPLNYLKNVLHITKDDLRGRVKDSQGNVRDDVLNSWDKNPRNLSMGRTPTSIPKGSTEVYFWGVPGSGKTCAMAAILSRARQMGCFAPRMGEGLGYMNELSTLFVPERDKPAVCLPAGSDVDTTQYLPLTLNEKVEGRNGKQVIKQHNISIIEISGEIFECFSREVEGKPYKSNEHKITYEKLKEYLRNEDNPKYHFFILDSKPLRDSDQMLYLQNAALYFKEKGVFNWTTQGISLIVTKSDVLSPNRSEWTKYAVKSAEEYFSSLVTQLKVIIGDPRDGGLGLSDGSMKVIPLSIGEVFFQNLCLFDPEPASVLVKLLMEYSKVAEDDSWRKKTKRFFNR